MGRPRYVLQRLRTLWRSQELDDEIGEELAFHIEQRTADNMRQGMPAIEARREAEKEIRQVPSD